ncbi:unnamed protein product [Mycena citricolor]|uniref:F-box domain-containing protein n=1 Tax=Mycena citricolor TaxID=2018698 RepID=A0AAD2JVL4_9AGAR|nr:unnamed protein product [Mycena citricolor]
MTRLTAHFPNELWIAIFSHVDRLSLRAPHLASRLFHDLVHPLLFHTVDFHPFRASTKGTTMVYNAFAGQHEVVHNVRRFEAMCADPGVAPHVRRCAFSSFHRSTVDPAPVHRAFFTAFMQLVRIRHLELFHVRIDAHALRALGAFELLGSVRVTGCELRLSDGEAEGLTGSVRVESMACAIGGTPEYVRAAGGHRWVQVLDRTILEALVIPFFDPTVFFEQCVSDPVAWLMRRLHTLRVSLRLDWGLLHAFAAFIPHLRTLELHEWPAAPPEPGSELVLLRGIDSYEGPHCCLPHFPATASPTTPGDVCAPDVLQQCLVFFPSLLELHLKVHDISWLAMIHPIVNVHTCETFLTELAHPQSEFCRHRSLEKFCFVWNTVGRYALTSDRDGDDSDADDEGEDDVLFHPIRLDMARASRVAFADRLPRLRALWIRNPVSDYLWTTDCVGDRYRDAALQVNGAF